MFVNRTVELQSLETLYHSKKAELFVLYGRRRVGKTELLRAFSENKPNLFFVATLSSDSDQLASFSQQIWRFTHTDTPEGFTFPSWEAAFTALADLPGRPVVILDEFTYLISGNKAIPSVMQKVWDERLKNTQIVLILCGSYIGILESEVLGYQAPLYGRRTGSLFLKPMEMPAVGFFFPNYSAEERFRAWGILGGMPYYLQIFSDQLPLEENIRKHILEVQGTLRDEPRLLLMEELREPRNYFSVLRAIAQGRTRLNEIAQASGIGPVTTGSRYLDVLQQMRLITRRVPVTESQPEKSKKGIYQVDDHFLRFWFRYVHPNLGSLDIGLTESVLRQRILPDLDHFLATAFEEACQSCLARMALRGKLPFLPERIGSWWDRDTEIDVVAMSESENVALIGECKWSVHPVGMNVLDDLKQKSAVLQREMNGLHVSYALFARTGFTPDLRRAAEKEGVLLVAASDRLFTD